MRVLEALEQLLECAEQELDPPTCRQFINPGGTAPFDTCSASNGNDGQVWVGHTSSLEGWPVPSGEPWRCDKAFAETIEVGVVRCAKGIVTGNGKPPAPELITEDAYQQEEDRLALRRAILCCLGIEHLDLIVVDWNPVEPEGGCVGGVWQIKIRDAGCFCDDES